MLTGEKTEDSMTKRILKNSFVFVLTSLLLIVSCGRDVVFTDSVAIPESTWTLNEKPSFEVQITDTIVANNVSFLIRTGSDYPFRNIFIFVKTVLPDGKILTDTVQYNLADEKGNWYGRGFGDIHSLSLPYKSNIYFPLNGKYLFEIQHGMRIEDLEGVYDIGLKVEKIRK
jgi:gliding motility-associated lipoprotein GldH